MSERCSEDLEISYNCTMHLLSESTDKKKEDSVASYPVCRGGAWVPGVSDSEELVNIHLNSSYKHQLMISLPSIESIVVTVM